MLSLPLDSLSSEPRRQYFLRVTELPITANELDLRTYFEDRKNGGGPVLKIDLRGGAGEADIYFDDENSKFCSVITRNISTKKSKSKS